MGVPGYFAAARRICPAALVAPGRRAVAAVPPFETLYVDFNCVVHNAVGDCGGRAGDGDVLERTVRLLASIVADCSPSASVVVCADGVPPEAKMAQQRNRRFMACKRGECGAFDRNKITPGTAFTAALDLRMKEECAAMAGRTGLAVEYSGTDQAGEGEQKIMRRLRETPGGGASCVYGLDADLVLLCGCLAAQGLNPPWLCREERYVRDGLTYVDAGRLAAGMAGGASPRALWNHVVCSFLCGNDFLPPASCLSVSRDNRWLPRLREACDSMRLALVADGGEELDWGAVSALLARLADGEDEDFRRADREYWAAARPAVASASDAWDNYPILNRNDTHRSIRPGDAGWRARYYALLFGARSAGSVNRVVGEYIRGLRWAFDYYRGAFPPPAQAPAWFYPYEYGPTLLDLHGAVASSAGEPACADLSSLDRTAVPASRLIRFVTPRGSAAVLPDPEEPRKPDHLFPVDAAITTYLRRKLWDCKAVLPPGCSLDVEA